MTMTERFGRPRVLVACVTAVVVGLATLAARPYWKHETLSVVTTKAESHGSGGTLGNAIKVHGHWAIDVRNPDGTLAAHHEFENSLVPDVGPWGLAHLLAREVTVVRGWSIHLGGSSGPCRGWDGTPVDCIIDEPEAFIDPRNADFDFATLTLSVGQAGVEGGRLKLIGDFTAFYTGQISHVETNASYRYTASGSTIVFPFSSRSLDQGPIPLAAGQHVFVTVTFSFS